MRLKLCVGVLLLLCTVSAFRCRGRGKAFCKCYKRQMKLWRAGSKCAYHKAKYCHFKRKALSTWFKRYNLFRAAAWLRRHKRCLKNHYRNKNGITYLDNSHFKRGTLRIRKPGKYILKEDIVFNPNPGTDNSQLNGWMPRYPQQASLYPPFPHGPYHMGFFAAISVETSNVVIDLGGHSIRQSKAHYLQQRFFALIELANMPFIPGQGPANFGSNYVAANNTVIRNGILGLSSHHGIHGNGVSRITIEKLVIKDFEVGGIALNGFRHVTIRNCRIGPSFRRIPVLGYYSNGRFLLPLLKKVATTRPSHKMYFQGGRTLTVLQTYNNLVRQLNLLFKWFTRGYRSVAYDPQWAVARKMFANPSRLPDGSAVYGILLSKKGVAIMKFGCKCGASEPIPLSSDVLISHVTITGLTMKANEIPAIAVGESAVALGPRGDVFDAMRASNNNLRSLITAKYKGNVIADAQLALAKWGTAKQKKGTNIPDKILRWAEGKASLRGTTFRCNGDIMFHVNKGVVGIRVDFGTNIRIRHSKIRRLVNLSPLGSTLCGRYSNPDNGGYVNQSRHQGYGGNEVRGISLVRGQMSVASTKLNTIVSTTGDARGIDVMKLSKANLYNVAILHVLAGYHVRKPSRGWALPNTEPLACGVPVSKRNATAVGHKIEIDVSGHRVCRERVYGPVHEAAGPHVVMTGVTPLLSSVLSGSIDTRVTRDATDSQEQVVSSDETSLTPDDDSGSASSVGVSNLTVQEVKSPRSHHWVIRVAVTALLAGVLIASASFAYSLWKLNKKSISESEYLYEPIVETHDVGF